MIISATADPILISSSVAANHRTRPPMSERSLLAESTPPASESSSASDHGNFPRREQPVERQAENANYTAASMFAAAVIAGAMPPAPTTIEEVIMRIGSIPLPPESEARLKDLLA
ncbi:MAG TPA: hypothetical protein VGN60_08515 [Devosia sp.]|jgi:hypothetical protein|nr:hypothetical protein [Devosia sp.]